MICDDDGLPCTLDRCVEPAGVCEHAAEPDPDCHRAIGSLALIDHDIESDDGQGNKSNSLKWKWFNGREVVLPSDEVLYEDFGVPDAVTDYDLCVFDSSGGAYSIASQLHLPNSSIWRPIGDPADKKGWNYKDVACTVSGVCAMKLRPDTRIGDGRGTARLALRAKGPLIPLPDPVSSEHYLAMDTKVVAQLRASGGECWAVTWEDGHDIFKNQVKKSTAKYKTRRKVLIP